MNGKFYLLAALLGGVIIFAWGSITHLAIPFWDDVMRELPNEQAVVDALKGSGVQNGIYYGMQGLLLVTFFGSGMADGAGMAGPMVTEFISNMLVALLLAWLLVRTNVKGHTARGCFAIGIGLLGWLDINVSYWNWYHFPFAYILLEATDTIFGMFFAGLGLSWLMDKQQPAKA